MVDLVSTAYGVKPETVTGGPAWLESDRFDVIAKAPNELNGEPLKVMLRALVADRFGLAVHQDTKPMPAWLLTAGKNPRMKQSDGAGDSRCGDDPALHSASNDRFRGGLPQRDNGRFRRGHAKRTASGPDTRSGYLNRTAQQL